MWPGSSISFTESRRQVQPRLPDRPSHGNLRGKTASRFPTKAAAAVHVEAGLVPEDRAVLVGYPKADVLTPRTSDARTMAASLGLDKARPTDLRADFLAGVRAELRRVKRSSRRCSRQGATSSPSCTIDPWMRTRYTGHRSGQRLARFSGPHFRLATGGDSTPHALASDVMVTDHSSTGFPSSASRIARSWSSMRQA